jgi:hypothetical protein
MPQPPRLPGYGAAADIRQLAADQEVLAAKVIELTTVARRADNAVQILSGRLSALESLKLGDTSRAEQQSSHEWDVLLATAGKELSKRVKDPRDPLSSDRAKAIAKEVYETTRDAATARTVGRVIWLVAAGLVSLAFAFLAGRLLH